MTSASGARRIPSLSTSGLLGHLPAFRSDPLALLLDGFDTHGDAVDFRLFNRRLALLAHPELVRHTLQDQAANYDKRTRGFEVLRLLLRDGLLTSEGEHWLQQRRIAQPAFHKARIAGFGDSISAAADALADDWLERRHPEDATTGERVVDVTAAMMKLTLRIIGQTLLSADVTGAADRVSRALEITLAHANDALARIIPRPLWWPTPAARQLRQAMATLDRVILDIIAERRHQTAAPDDLLTMLMSSRDADTGESMSDPQLRDEVMTIFLAGHETTAIALAWTWYLLAQHPKTQRRVETEVDQTVGDRQPGVAELPHLSYIARDVKEAMRLYPPAWVISRNAVADDDAGRFRVQKGTIVLLSPYVTHRHPQFWRRPAHFDPEHFAEDQEAARPPFAYFPFGGGPRQCIGNTFALMELVLVVATLARRCRLELVEPPDVGTSPSITLRPDRPIRMRILSRERLAQGARA